MTPKDKARIEKAKTKKDSAMVIKTIGKDGRVNVSRVRNIYHLWSSFLRNF